MNRLERRLADLEEAVDRLDTVVDSIVLLADAAGLAILDEREFRSLYFQVFSDDHTRAGWYTMRVAT